jgi:hypothetical protein
LGNCILSADQLLLLLYRKSFCIIESCTYTRTNHVDCEPDSYARPADKFFGAIKNALSIGSSFICQIKQSDNINDKSISMSS